MTAAQPHPFEDARLRALRELEILDTETEAVFDDIVELASLTCQTPISLVTLIDDKRQWFKAAHGIEAGETPRELAFCAHAILSTETMIVEDALEDVRFRDNPFVTGEPKIRFYAGCPLITSSGLPLGTLCAVDRVPRTLTTGQERALAILAQQAVAHLEARAALASLQRASAEREVDAKVLHRWLMALAHDLRAPFTSIIGLTELLTEDFLLMGSEEVRACLADLNRAAHHGHRMLENFLDVCLYKSGMKTPESKEVHLEGLLAKVEAVVSGRATRKGIGVDVIVESGLVMVSDPKMLASVLQNLLTNAIKFTAAGGRVQLKAYRDGATVCVIVSDSGVGIDPATLARMNAGDSVGSSRGTMGETGSGWGLRISRDFCELCGGSLTFRSKPGEGTSCLVRFPERRATKAG